MGKRRQLSLRHYVSSILMVWMSLSSPSLHADAARLSPPNGLALLRMKSNDHRSLLLQSIIRGGHQDDDNHQDERPTSQTEDQEQNHYEEQQSERHPQKAQSRLFGGRSRGKAVSRLQQSSTERRLQEHLDQQRSSSSSPATTVGEEDATSDYKHHNRKNGFLSALGPSVVALWAHRGGAQSSQAGVQILKFTTIYTLSLLGSSIGFYSFLYFISVGYALGITLPVMAALRVYRHNQKALTAAAISHMAASTTSHIKKPVLVIMGFSTFLHSSLVVLWGIRAFTFFLWRENVNWPELHKQIRHVNEHNAPTLPVKGLIWTMYSFVYTAMLSPCWFRLAQSARIMKMAATSGERISKGGFHPVRWFASSAPIFLQLMGLTLESVADYQKSTFKAGGNRYEWCHVGLWGWSTHPNYLGEMIFWTGTYLGWLFFTMFTLVKSHISLAEWMVKFAFCTLGYVFILAVLRGSIQSMDNKHWQKYGHEPFYAVFRQGHGLLGPKRRKRDRSSNSSTNATTSTNDNDNTNGNGQQQPDEAIQNGKSPSPDTTTKVSPPSNQ